MFERNRAIGYLALALVQATLAMQAHAQIVEIIDATGDGIGNPLDGAADVDVDASGNVFVAGGNSANVFRITPGGTISEIIDITGDGAGNLFQGCEGLAVDSVGNVYAVGLNSANAFRIAPGGTITEIIDPTGDGAGNTLAGPRNVSVDSGDNVYVTGESSDNAFRITPVGAITEIIDAGGDGIGNPLDAPYGVAADSSGNVYVAGSATDNAFRITSGGVITEIVDATGDGAGNVLDFPRGIAVDGDGNVYVAGIASNNVLKITPGGTITEVIDASGDGAGNTLTGPSRVAVDDDGNLYVAGSTNAFQVTPGGTITEIIDSTGDGAGNVLFSVFGIAADSNGSVFVAGLATDNAFEITLAPTPDIDNVSIEITRFLPADDYRFRVSLEGTSIADAALVPPVGASIPLTCAGSPFADCEYEETFASLTALEARFPAMAAYDFDLNGATTSFSLTHRGFVSPTDHADIDYSPKLAGGCTSTTPTFTWTCPVGCQAADQLDIQLVNPALEIFNASYMPPVAGSVPLPSGPFAPTPTDLEGALAALVGGERYALSASTEDLLVTNEMVASDTFEFSDESKVDDVEILLPDCVAILDDFNDDSLDPILWDLLIFEDGSLDETNQRMEYTSPGSTMGEPIDENDADLRLKIEQPFATPWTLEVDTHVEDYLLPQLPSEYEYGIELAVENTADPTDALSFIRVQGDDGAGSGLASAWGVFKATDDVDLIDDFFPAGGSDGALTLDWDGTSFRLIRTQSSGVKLLQTVSVADWGMGPGDTFTLYIGADDTSVFSPLNDGSRVYFDTVRLPEPEGGAMLIVGMLALIGLRRGRRRTD